MKKEDCCGEPYRVGNPGTSRSSRPSPALDPATAPLDDRDLADLLVWVRRLSEHVRYFHGETLQGDQRWARFFERAPLVLLAELVKDPGALNRAEALAAQDHPVGRAIEELGTSGLSADPAKARHVEARAGGWLEELLTWPRHAPHVALLVAVFRLFRHQQARLNGLVGEHLDFIYERVLQLQRRAPEPDRVHVVFELAKGRERHRLVAGGTLLDAGKGEDGQPICFALERDVVVNRAQVAEIRAVWRQRPPNATTGWEWFRTDPDGAKDAPPFWAMDAHPGVASAWRPAGLVSSPTFQLPSGKRALSFKVEGSANAADIECQYSTAEGWATPSPIWGGHPLDVDTDESGQWLTVGVSMTDPGIEAMPELLPDPVLRFEGAEGLSIVAGTAEDHPTVFGLWCTDLHIETKGGPVDATKPFLPFGAVPRVGDTVTVSRPGVTIEHLYIYPFGWQSGGAATVAEGTITATEDWGFAAYPANLAKAVICQSTNRCGDLTTAQKEIPPAPQAPEIHQVRARYSAQLSLEDGDLSVWATSPFGLRQTDGALVKLPLVGDEMAALYLGLSDATPGDLISLLVEVVEGSADPLTKPGTIEWQWLGADDEWHRFNESEIAIDRTQNFQRTGVVAFTLPRDIAASPVMTSALVWVRAVLSGQLDSVCKIQGIQAQGARAVRTSAGGPRIPAGTISKVVGRPAAIKSVSQPAASFGGRPAEPAAAFRQRTSERLRHRGRGITLWDYERLVLEQFPDIYQVRCLNHTRPKVEGTSGPSFDAPGHVTLVVVPDVRLAVFNRLEPRVSTARLEEIKAFLSGRSDPFQSGRISPFVTLHVENPVYETVKVEGKLRYHPGVDQNAAAERISEGLVGLLSPWTSGQQELQFGGSVYASSIVHFIEEDPDVDAVMSIEYALGRDPLPDDPAPGALQRLPASSALAVLTSAAPAPPAAAHVFTPWTEP